MRTGLITKKIGMSRIFQEDGMNIPVTVLSVENCYALERKTVEKNGYSAIKIGAFTRKKVNKPQQQEYSKLNISPLSIIKEFRIDKDVDIEIGKELSVSHFVVGQKVDAIGTSIGKGFAGAMKRHNFSGLRASHGVSISHRSHGSTGQCQDPGKVFKGKKMAGHMGNAKCTVQNLTVAKIDIENNLIFVKGSVPGAKNSFIVLQDAIKIEGLKDLAVITYRELKTKEVNNEG